ncbi:unnamed protein product [Spirodela intermedia]|uniref:Uncharacterized protein n=2 Tax=Spirodela intermedia TaxID=51605 RepID=A0A7I8JY82_SPIIN|nr:unnamed protein product [Spirodela intermedia]CAA6654364.1 unnamed protein product [Spirodela intermedia]CAA7388930.1 unnamed protein product [Spirodela intermedia]
METDPWNRFAAELKRREDVFQSRSDLYMGFEEVDGGDDDPRAELPCPFCSEDFDIVGLCCHIDDEHPVEADNGVCPICESRVDMDMVGHITMEHGNLFKISFFPPHHMQSRRKLLKGYSRSNSRLALLRKELRDGHIQSLMGGSSYALNQYARPDPLLSAFISTFSSADSSKYVEPQSFDEGSMLNKKLNDEIADSWVSPAIMEPSLSDKDREEQSRRSEFLRELVVSTIFEDPL